MPDLVMHPPPPFRLDLTVWALRRMPSNEMDAWDGTTYRRVVTADEGAVRVAVTQVGGADEPELRVSLNDCADVSPRGEVAGVEEVLASLLGFEADLEPFYRLVAADDSLGRLARRFRGLKPPRFPSVFEGVVNGIACQQLSLSVGIALLNRLCAVFGRACGDMHAFPTPADLASADTGELRSLGFSTRKAGYIVRLARTVESGEVHLEALRGLEDGEAVAALDSIEGVGRWTAQYTALRALGRLDVFPADDVGSQNKIKQWLSLEKRPGYEETNRRIAGFRPYRGLIYFHLLLNHMAERGIVSPLPGEE